MRKEINSALMTVLFTYDRDTSYETGFWKYTNSQEADVCSILYALTALLDVTLHALLGSLLSPLLYHYGFAIDFAVSIRIVAYNHHTKDIAIIV